MLPNSDHSPFIALELFVVQFGKFDVAADLSFPVFSICLGEFSVADGASMPKTTINEHDNSSVGEDNVRFARNLANILPPSLQAHSCKHCPKASFEFCTLAFDCSHCFLAIFRFEVVAHDRVERVERRATDDNALENHSEPMDSTHVQQSRKLPVRTLRRRTQ